MIDRYSRAEMASLWTLQARYQSWLNVELAATQAWAKLGVVPQDAADAMQKNAKFDVERISEIEATTRHDVVAFTRCVAESLGEESKYLHYGLTSTDVCDTALATLLVKATDIILRDVDDLLMVLAAQAKAYQYTPCMGRTHGVHAEPTTLGLKFALWYADMTRCKARLLQARKTIGVGKISGAVGNFANVDPFIEKYVCESLGLAVAPISTQVLQRDRHAEFLSTLAILGGCMEKIATEIRGLQKTETREVEEPFYAGQKGSSAMPHKRNPINSEKICGLARMLRGYALVGFENIALWHERDISHSSTERITLSDATILTDYMLAQITRILKDLFVYPENMLRNFNASYHLVFSQQVLLTLIGKGLLRETAYDLVQRCAMSAWENKRDFKAVLSDEPQIQELLTPAELDGCFDVNYYMKHVADIFQRVGIE